MAMSPLSLGMVVLAEVVTHWLTTGMPLIVAAPVMAGMLNMNTEGIAMLLLVLLLGTPSLSLIGAIGAALILGARRGGVAHGAPNGGANPKRPKGVVVADPTLA